MPATHRERLAAGDYLRAQPPSWATLQSGLAIFALFVIVRYCVRCAYSWLRSADQLNSNLVPPNSFDQHYQPSARSIDEKPRLLEQLNDQHSSSGKDLPRRTIAHWGAGSDSLPVHFLSRLPPAPPFTPPELSSSVFTLDERPYDPDSFIHQPNPDYMSSTSTSAFQADNDESSSIPRRRSYTKTIPVGVPVPRSGQPSEAESTDFAFLSNPYPQTSQRLPLAPPVGQGSDDDAKAPRNVNVQGEIISALDRDGAGWTRHTRVYGGGACLACAAAGGGHGGGFYGATVTPEEMR